MRAVNLLPRDDGAGGRRLPPLPALVACGGAVVVAAVLALSFLSASAKVGQERQALQTAQAQYAAIPAPPPKSPVATALPQEHQTRVTALATALGQRMPWDRLLREVSQVVPSDVWLISLNASAPSVQPPAVAGALPQEFIVTGCTYSQPSVARFLARLDVVPDLQNVTLAKALSGGQVGGASTDTSLCPKGTVTFTLQGDLRVSAVSS